MVRRSIVLAVLLTLFVSATVISAEPGGSIESKRGAATVLSLAMPGTGEWLNADFAGKFPWSECIIGCICFPIQLSSALDAAAGDTDTQKMRFNFWTKPEPKAATP